MITDRFQSFYSTLKKGQGNAGIASFVFEVEKISFTCILNEIQSLNQDYFHLIQPDSGIKLLGWNSLVSVSFSGVKRIELSENAINEFGMSFSSNWNEFPTSDFPLFMGGLKFRPDENPMEGNWGDYDDSEWFIPSYSLFQNKDRFFLIYNFFTEADPEIHFKNLQTLSTLIKCVAKTSDQKFQQIAITHHFTKNDDLTSWESKVREALKIISDNDAEKIVLSRQVEYDLSATPEIAFLVEELSASYPTCHTFAFRKGSSIFFGASPERLARVSEGWIEADALAGSAPRGETEEADLLIANTELKNKKNLKEQKAVVDFIVNSFGSFSEEIQFDIDPQIKKLPNIQHLWTPIRARLKKNGSVFSLLKEIHPTPAICGVPWSKALTFINNTESHKRGLYAGIIGWFNFNNEGDFIVALRSGLIKGNKLYAFAGCGIVEGSDPNLEYKESELKLRPILSLFKNGKED